MQPKINLEPFRMTIIDSHKIKGLAPDKDSISQILSEYAKLMEFVGNL